MARSSRYHQADYAADYDHDRFGGGFGAGMEQDEVALYLRLLAGCKGPVLDAGCGTGKLSLPLLAGHLQTVSADLSPEMLSQARAKAGAAGLNLSGLLADIQALAFRDRSFAACVSSRALMHVPDWRRGLAELCRVTGDLLIFDIPPTWSSSGLDALRRRLEDRRPGHSGHPYHTFTAREVTRELRQHGFEVLEQHRAFFLPVAFHRRLERPALSRRLERIFSAMGLTHFLGAPVTLKARRRPPAAG
jgi:SAM-dependent methyltransferase